MAKDILTPKESRVVLVCLLISFVVSGLIWLETLRPSEWRIADYHICIEPALGGSITILCYCPTLEALLGQYRCPSPAKSCLSGYRSGPGNHL